MSRSGAKRKEEYERLKKEAQSFYFGIRHAFSPALKSEVRFTASGFRHLIDGADGEREEGEQIRRFKLLPHAVTLIATSASYASHYNRLRTFDVDAGRGQGKKAVRVSFWSIVGVIESRRIRVVLQRVGQNGGIRFLSVYREHAPRPRRHKSVRCSTTIIPPADDN